MVEKELPVRVLSLWAPWIWSILHAGKDVENRTRSFPRSFVGEFWLHGSLWPGTRKPLNDRQRYELDLGILAAAEPVGAKPPTIEEIDAMRGKIIGRVTVTGYSELSPSPWYVPGSLGLELRAPKPLREYVPAVGAQGWWFVKPAELAALRAAL